MVRLSFLFKVFRSKDYALLPFCLFQLKYGQYTFMVGWPHSERLYHVVFCLLCHSLVFQYCTSWAYDEHIFQFHALCRAIVDEVYAVSSVGVGHPVEVFNRGIRIVCSICKTRMCHCVWVLSAIGCFSGILRHVKVAYRNKRIFCYSLLSANFITRSTGASGSS